MTIEAGLVRVWIRLTGSPGKVSEMKSYRFYNCSDRTVGVRYTTSFDRDGHDLGATDDPLPRRLPIVPDSMDEVVYGALCQH